MGQSKSKVQPYPQFAPPGYPPYGPAYPYALPPAPLGYGPGFNGPGFVPPGFGPQVTMPQPAVPWQQPTKRRKRNKEKSSSSTGHAARQQSAINANANPASNAQAAVVDSLPPGFIPSYLAPNSANALASAPVIPPAPAAANQQPPPLFTPGAGGGIPLTGFPSPQVTTQQPPAATQRRAATPFIPPFPQVDGPDGDAHENMQPQRQTSTSHRRSQSQSQSHHNQHHQRSASAPHPAAATHTQPVDLSAYMTQAPPNPLPQPPRDLYQLSPYKRLLNLPQTMSLLTGTTGTGAAANPNVTVVRANTTAGMAGVGAGMNTTQHGRKKTRSKKGFFGFGNRHGQDDEASQQGQQPTYGNIHFVPIPVYQDRSSTDPTGSSRVAAPGGGERHGQAPVPPIPTPPSPPPQRSPPHSPPPDVQRASSPTSHHRSQSRNSRHTYAPQQQQQQQQQQQHQHQQSTSSSSAPMGSNNVIEFNQQTHPGFLNHSPHRVLYANRTYPTATHLHEALKFLDHRSDFAERIRLCQSVQDVYPLSLSLQAWVRPDWGMVYLNKMEEVLWNKFRQHPELRSLLMGTGDGELVYADVNDEYWGSGNAIGETRGTGANQLGKLLVKVRERLRVEGLP